MFPELRLKPSRPRIIEAFGQTWHITPQVLTSLAPYGVGPPPTVKAMVIDLTSSKGLKEGDRIIDYLGVELKISVRGELVRVDDPYTYTW